MNPGQRSPSKPKAQSQIGSTCTISLLMPHICVLMALPPSASGAAYAALDVFCALPPPATEVQHLSPMQQLQSLHSYHHKTSACWPWQLRLQHCFLACSMTFQAYTQCKAWALYQASEAACNTTSASADLLQYSPRLPAHG